MTKPPKPVLSLKAGRLFQEIIEYVRQYTIVYTTNPDQLPQAASDVMDGYKLNSNPEVQELIKKCILRRVGSRRHGDDSWHLTDYACRIIREYNPIDKYTMTEEHFFDARDSGDGYCTTCQDWTAQGGTEPDVDQRTCWQCKKATVVGADVALQEGYVHIRD